MRASRFIETIDELHKRLHELTATKGEEYKRRDENQFANFERLAGDLKLLPEQVLWVYLKKHLDSIINAINDLANGVAANVRPSEPILGRVDDAILYLLLLRGMFEERQSGGHWLLDKSEGACRGVKRPGIELYRHRGAPEKAEEPAQAAGTMMSPPTPTPPLSRHRRARTVVISPSAALAYRYCAANGFPAATAVIMHADSLYGLPAGTVVHIVSNENTNRGPGTRYSALFAEVAYKCDKCAYVLREIIVPEND